MGAQILQWVMAQVHVYFVVLFALVVCMPGANANENAAEEFEIIKQYQKERVQDFYSRFIFLDRLEAERRRGEEEIRRERKQVAEEAEAARKAFVLQRKSIPPQDPAAWEREVKARQQEHEKARAEYVRRRNEMRSALRRSPQINEIDEYDLYDYTEPEN